MKKDKIIIKNREDDHKTFSLRVTSIMYTELERVAKNANISRNEAAVRLIDYALMHADLVREK